MPSEERGQNQGFLAKTLAIALGHVEHCMYAALNHGARALVRSGRWREDCAACDHGESLVRERARQLIEGATEEQLIGMGHSLYQIVESMQHGHEIEYRVASRWFQTEAVRDESEGITNSALLKRIEALESTVDSLSKGQD